MTTLHSYRDDDDEWFASSTFPTDDVGNLLHEDGWALAPRSLYDYPLLYDAVRAPLQGETQILQDILQRHLGRPLTSVADPACGPGNWLEPFAARSIFVGGNDLAPQMVATARKRLPADSSEVTEGDMRQLSFRSAPFDAAFEMAGSIGMLTEVDSVRRFVRSLSRVLVSDGVAMLNAHFGEPVALDSLPCLCWTSGSLPVPPRHEASVTYELLSRDVERSVDWMRRSVRFQHADGARAVVQDEYPMRFWDAGELLELLRDGSGFRLEAVYRDAEVGWTQTRGDDLAGDRYLLLRRLPA